MANVDIKNGLNAHKGYEPKTPYPIANAYDTNLFVGDPVTLSGGTIVKFTAGTANEILGSIVGFECREGMDKAGFYPKDSTDHYIAIVADGVGQFFECYEDGDTTPIALDDIGKTGNFIATHAGDPVTGLSGVELDSSSFSGSGQAATDQAQLIGFVERTGNELGAHACWIIKIHNHYLNQANHA